MASAVRILTHNANGIYEDALTLQNSCSAKMQILPLSARPDYDRTLIGRILVTGPIILKAQTHPTGVRLW